MLKNSKYSRPDNQLKRSLLLLAYCLVLLTIVLSIFLRYPEYFFYLNLGVIVLTILCLLLTSLTLKDGEEALSYGCFVNEIIAKSRCASRIDNLEGDAVLQNELAKNLLDNNLILPFLQERLADTKSNMANFVKLQVASQKLKSEKVTITLSIGEEEKHFIISITPLFLKKFDIFEDKLKINKIKNDAYLFWTFEDITAEKNIEQIFFEERKYLHDFLDFLPVGVYTCDKDYNIEYVNEAFSKMLGISANRLIKNNLKDFVSKDCKFYNAKISYEGTAYFKRADEFNMSYVFQESVKENKKSKIRGIVMQNLPTDKDILEQLYLSNNKINWLFNCSPVGIMFIDKDGTILQNNVKIANILNKTTEELVNNSIYSVIKSPEDIETMSNVLKNIEKGAIPLSLIDINVGADNKDKILKTYITPMHQLHEENNKTEGFVVYLIDATEQKNLELQFAQAQKMQAIGQLAGGVAHDFNNLLTSILGFCDLLLQKHGVGDPSFFDLSQIRQNANRAASLVRQLLAFSRKQPLKPKLIDVTENFVELNIMLKRFLGEQISLNFYHGQNLGFIKVDPTQFSQVIINLAINAKDAMNGKGSLYISSRVENVKDDVRFGDNIVKAGTFVVIDVTDTGCGISEENLSRIFEPFFSTKKNVVGSGTGLGLSMVYGIVQQTQGFIKVKSELNKGTTFSIYLPRFDGTEEPLTEENIVSTQANAIGVDQKMMFGMNVSSIESSIGRGKKVSGINILFAEDEDSVRTVVVRALEKKGFNVVACDSAENALEQIKINKNFQLLITDMMMPGMNGMQLANEVRKQIKNIKIILASGYSEEIVGKGLKTDEYFEFVDKPFSLANLTQKIFSLLGGTKNE